MRMSSRTSMADIFTPFFLRRSWMVLMVLLCFFIGKEINFFVYCTSGKIFLAKNFGGRSFRLRSKSFGATSSGVFKSVFLSFGNGDVAQLVEHHNGIVGVRGSTPLVSTTLKIFNFFHNFENTPLNGIRTPVSHLSCLKKYKSAT